MPAESATAPKLIARAQSAARSGNVAAARKLYREVLDRFPANRRARQGLARLARTAGEESPSDAIAALLTSWRAGRFVETLALTDSLPVSHPTVRDIRAAALRKLGQPGSAIPIYDAALKEDPQNAALWFNAGAARLEDHRLAEAQACLAQACAISPEPAHILALVQCKIQQGHDGDAESLAGAVLARSDVSKDARVRAHGFRGKALLHLGRTAEALDEFAVARALAPEDATILHDVGIAANALGDRAAAEESFRSALALAPERTEIHRSLSAHIRYTAEEPHLAQMTALLTTGLDPAAEAELRFALFKAMDDIEDLEAAAEHLIRGNELRRERLRYDPAQDKALFERLATLSPPDLDGTPSDGPRPIFVLGLPRSGTTLTEQILSGAACTVPAGELPNVGQAAAALLRALPQGPATPDLLAEFAAKLRRDFAAHAGPGDVLIDKMPLNFRWADLILASLPDARIVWLDRDPRANSFSLYRHCFAGSGNGFAYGMDDIARMIAAERAVRDRVIARWPDRVHVLELERMTADPEPEIRALVAFCGLDWSENCLAPHLRHRAVLTASNQQVRRGIEPAARDDWTRYARWLTPLSPTLQEQGSDP